MREWDTKGVWLLGYLLIFILATGLLMFVNTVALNLGDSKFGEFGWFIYWPMWVMAFSPLILIASVSVHIWWRPRRRTMFGFLTVTLIVYLAAMQIAFLNTFSWTQLAISFLVLAAATFFMAWIALRRS
jgi:hypothetical protein